MSQWLVGSALGRESTTEGPEMRPPTRPRLSCRAAEGTPGAGHSVRRVTVYLDLWLTQQGLSYLGKAAVAAFFQALDTRLQNEQSFLQTSPEPQEMKQI